VDWFTKHLFDEEGGPAAPWNAAPPHSFRGFTEQEEHMDIGVLTGVTDDADLEGGPSVFSVDHAKTLVALFARTTTNRDLEGFLAGFTDDCIVQYPPSPTVYGKAALRPMIQAFMTADREQFVCEKRLRSISGNVLGVIWINRWLERKTGKRKITKGVEFWTMRGNQIARWDASSTTWDA
jgi:ketosteroid isomerase-like protein